MAGTDSKAVRLGASPAALLVRGHFLGKEGGHINGRLSKQVFFQDRAVFSALLAPFRALVEDFDPTVLIAEQKSAVLVAKYLRSKLSIGMRAVEKCETAVSFEDQDMARPLIVEDNLVSGASVLRLNGLLSRAGALPIGVASVFDSNGSAVDAIELPCKSLYSLDILSWSPEQCEQCAKFGSHTLGLALEDIGAL